MNGIQAYRRTQAHTSTPLELIVMLYDGVLKYLAQARAAIERGDISARRNAIDRTLAIVSELQSTLNLEQGGDTATTLDRLYGFVNQRLFHAAVHNDPQAIDEVRRVLEPLRDAWHAIATTQPQGATPQTPGGPSQSPAAP